MPDGELALHQISIVLSMKHRTPRRPARFVQPRQVRAIIETLLRDYRHCSQRRTRPALDLHRQRNDERPAGRKTIEIRQVLEGRHVALVQDAVRFVHRRLPVVDARRVEADGLHSPGFRKPFRGVGVQTGEMQLRDRRVAALGRAEIPRGVGPEA